MRQYTYYCKGTKLLDLVLNRIIINTSYKIFVVELMVQVPSVFEM